MTKIIAKVIGAAMVLSFVVAGAAPTAQAVTIEELQAQIDALLAQLATLSGGTTTGGYTYSADLTLGSTGADVVALQTMLVEGGFLTIPAGVSKGYFGPLTQAALASYQAANGIAPAVGYFGPITRAKVNASVSTGGTTTTSSSNLQGGAGSVDSYTLTSGLNGEEVGEDQDDVEIAGLDIENSDDSDIEIKAVKVVFDEGTGATSDFDKYASEVTVWFDGKKVGSEDADDFTDDNSWTQTITLDAGVVIDSGDTESLIVAVSGINNLDTNDAGDTWDIDFTSVRFKDAQGTVVSEDPTTAIRNFTFENFATAADIELKITSGDASINDGRAILVKATEATDNVDVFSFDVEIEGDSDVRVDDFSIEGTVAGAGQIDELFDNITLTVDGVEVTSVVTPTDEETVLFDDLNLDLAPGDHEFVVSVDFLAVSGALDEGDTFSFTIGETETDLTNTDIDDENGDSLADGDITGSASSETHGVYSVAIDVELVSVDSEAQLDGAGGTDDDTGVFTMVFDITALGGTVYIGDTAAGTTVADGSVGIAKTDSIVYRVYDSGTATTDDLADVTTWTTPAGVTDGGVEISIEEGSTARASVTVTQTNDSTEDDGIYYLDLASIGWDSDSDDSVYEYSYIYNLDAFETPTVNLN